MYEIRRSSGASTLVEIVLMLCLIGLFLLIVAVCFIVKTFLHYYTHKALWIALAVFLGLSVIGGVLAVQVNQAWMALCYVGFAVLLITAKAVDMRNRDTLMVEKTGLVNQVLHSSWFGGDDTPVAIEEEPIAA
jgi:predicted membrane protein